MPLPSLDFENPLIYLFIFIVQVKNVNEFWEFMETQLLGKEFKKKH